ncbi:hypothetical protein [Kribbella sp. CA-293567]|uniref:hypothetical protein n=1 Tax=Kribbella sp. CA-293567 TaxID=3002436 RepID=UPI0022DD8513|nr:hypothetical protein [Kribbella sp. CA-293567]WBQ03798.1 hypothetical protein OX958_27990 [Kribbella sp. CA-293567]
MATHLIGITGRKRSGKDTFAERLVTEHGFKRFAFADNLRKAALAIDPIVGVECGRYSEDVDLFVRLSEVIAAHGWEGVKDSPYDAEVRRTLQRVGVTARELDPGIWVRPVMHAIGNHDGPAVITDVRFPNELEAVHDADGWSVRVTRSGLPDDGDLHISETALDDAAVNLGYSNNSSISALHAKADECVRVLRNNGDAELIGRSDTWQ